MKVASISTKTGVVLFGEPSCIVNDCANMPDDNGGINQNAYEKFYLKLFGVIDRPVTYFKGEGTYPFGGGGGVVGWLICIHSRIIAIPS